MNYTGTSRLRIDIRHAEPLVAIGLLTALQSLDDMEAVLSVDGGVGDGVADIVVTDLAAALNASRHRGREPRGRASGARTLVVTTSEREQDVKAAFDHGIHGYLLVSSPIEEIVLGVRSLGRGECYLAAPVARRRANFLSREPLTPREIDVLRWVTRGSSNKAIAGELKITVGTVKAHVKTIMSKLEAHSRTHAASIALQRGLCDALHWDQLHAQT